MTPYILLGRKKLPPESPPAAEEAYDEQRQIWIDRISGEPLVSRLRAGGQPMVAAHFNDDRPLLSFEQYRRRRVIFNPVHWRIGGAQLPLEDSEGVK